MTSKLHSPTKDPSSSSSSSPSNNGTNNESKKNTLAIIIKNNNNGGNKNNNRGGSNKVAVTRSLSLSPSQIEKRRDYTKKQNIRRVVYRDMTSFTMFPLQAMAMDDYDGQAEDYFNVGEHVGRDDGVGTTTTTTTPTTEDTTDGSGSVARGDDDDDDDDDESILRHQYRREFLREKSISMHAAAAVEDGSVGAPAEVRVERQDSNGGQEVDNNPTKQEQDENSTAVDAAVNGGETPYHDAKDDKVNKSQESRSQNSITNSIEPNNQTQSIDSAKEQQPQQQNETNTGTITSSSSSQPLLHQTSSQFKLSTLWSMEPRIFANETTIKGKRRYISAHLGRFLDHYWRKCDVYNRHYYELIKEGTPCRLYFDLEFNKRANPLLTPTITETLLDQLFAQLQIQYQTIYNISIQRSDMVDLDSTTCKKFSRHWILHLPKNGALFSDAREAGLFVKRMVSRLEEEEGSGKLRGRGHDLLADNLFVNAEEESNKEEEDGNENNETFEKKKKKKLTRFIDLGVYTRNRIFRLLGSTKFGKPVDAALRIAEANEFPFPKGFDNSKFYLPEMNDRGAVVVDDDSDVTSCDGADAAGNNDDFKSFCKSLSWEDHADAMAVTLIVPANASKMSYPILTNPSDLLSDDEKQQITALRHLNGSGTGGGAPSKFARSSPSYGPSPLPKLEHFIANTLAMREGLVGSIGTWSLGGSSSSSSTSHHHPVLPQTASFNMKGNRYCENIQRAHKSNQIMWNVHLVDRTCWQGCHDPECRGFRGRSIDLPEEVNAEIDEYFMDMELSSLNERDIIGNKENAVVVAVPPPREEEDDGEFDDPALEAAMCQLDISGVAREKAEAAFDVELGELDLSDIIVSHNRGKSGPLLEKKNRIDVVASNHTKEPAESKTIHENNTMRSLDPWEDDDNLDSELAKLNLSNIVSS